MAEGIFTVEDVKRVMHALDADIDDELMPVVEAIEEHIVEITGRNFGQTGTVTERFHNVRQDALLYLADAQPASVIVNVYGAASVMVPSLLTLNSGYQVVARGIVQLLFTGAYIDPREGFTYYTKPGYYDRVEVTYTASGIVPKMVREAGAMWAASKYMQESAVLSGFQSENLGDYSYSRSSAPAGATTLGAMCPPEVASVLEPYSKARTRSV